MFFESYTIPKNLNRFKRIMKIIIILFSLITTLRCAAQTDTVDNYRPYLMEGGNQIRGSYTYAKPMMRNDTLHYWLVVIDTASGVKVYSKALDLNYNLSFVIQGYGLWVTDEFLGDHWEIFDEKFRKLSESRLIITKIIEVPK